MHYISSVLTVYYFKFIGSGANVAVIVVPIVAVLVLVPTIILISVTVIVCKFITKRKHHQGKYIFNYECHNKIVRVTCSHVLNNNVNAYCYRKQ